MQRKTGRFLATFLPSVLLIVAALVFSAGVNLGTFRRDCGDALFSTFGVAGRKVVTSIEYAVKYGKTIENFFGMERALSQLKTYLPQADGVAVALPDGQVAYAIGTYGFKDRIGDRLTGYEQRRTAGEFQHSPSFNYHDTDNRSHKLFLPIRDPGDGRWIGTLVIAAGDAVIDNYVREFERHTLIFVGALGAVAILLLGGLALLPERKAAGRDGTGAPRSGRPHSGRPHSGRTALAVAALVQITVGVTGYGAFSDAYLRTVENTTGIVENIVATDIASIIGRGATYRSLSGIDDYFREIIAIVPHFKGMSLAVPEGADLPGSLGSGQPAARGDLVTGRALATDADLVTPTLRIVIDSDYIQRNVLEVVANNVTILIISLMFIYELHAFVSRRMRRPVEAKAETEGVGGAAATTGRSLAGLRFLTFMLYFGMFLSASFVPVIMQTFDSGLFGLAPPQAAAIPVSAEMLCGALAILLAGRISARLPWRTMTAAGLAIAALGALTSGLTGDPVLFVVARGLVGAGTMTALMGLYRLIDRVRRVDPATGAYSDLFSGMYVGVNCGAVVGSLLADEIGPQAVFLIAAVVLALGIAQLLLLTPEPTGEAVPPVAAATAAVAKPDAAAPGRRVWSDRSFLAFLLLVSVPTSACSMFLIYYFPLFASGLGQPASTVGQAFLLYGLCIVYLGPLLSRLMRSSGVAPGLPVLASGLIMAAGLTTFALTGSLMGAFLAILLLGLSDSFGLTAQQRYLERLPVVGTHGLAVPQSYHLNARKIGQVIGPMLFSAAAVAGGAGATLIGLGLAAALLLHLALSILSLRRRPAVTGTA
ncbi:MFS family permease [Azospirillum lipoferum]|uniref:MFS transporter n=1 Tax=Azospirillum TaxID=191 RepID=UPI001FE8F92F|nr:MULTISPECIES: MFS transporter [Azospirillum]MCP1615175.1 MFS family permease [Azospirillum lipoferum]MDW5537032.1 MFS transporter [Azospirillum sp. NL1]